MHTHFVDFVMSLAHFLSQDLWRESIRRQFGNNSKQHITIIFERNFRFLSSFSCNYYKYLSVLSHISANHHRDFVCPTPCLYVYVGEMSRWHLSPSVNSLFKHACAAIHWGYTSDFWSGPSSTSIRYVCEQRRLWRDCSDAQSRLSLRCSPMRYLP